jgi:hypothetical protein
MSVMFELYVGKCMMLFNVMKVHALTSIINFPIKVVCFIDGTEYWAKFVI